MSGIFNNSGGLFSHMFNNIMTPMAQQPQQPVAGMTAANSGTGDDASQPGNSFFGNSYFGSNRGAVEQDIKDSWGSMFNGGGWNFPFLSLIGKLFGGQQQTPAPQTPAPQASPIQAAIPQYIGNDARGEAMNSQWYG